jgi:hypothetical protein
VPVALSCTGDGASYGDTLALQVFVAQNLSLSRAMTLETGLGLAVRFR